jgi:hypothetical protein
MSKIILGIHGLANKPPTKLLERWWKKALQEGLRAIGHPRRFFRFKLIYWADYLYPQPLDPTIKDKDNPRYIKNPYVPARRGQIQRAPTLRKKILNYVERQLTKIMINEDLSINYAAVSDLIIRRYFKDLDTYYSKQCLDRKHVPCQAKDVIRAELALMLRKYKRKDILLIAHSMGSIVAYDVLTCTAPDVTIHTLVTMGSPLGLPPIMIKILAEQHTKPHKPISVRTPENIVGAWYNFSDLRDKVATPFNLSDEYKPNFKKINAVDDNVTNNYEYQGDPNPHNVYGYLRTPEMAEVTYNFLNAGQPKPLIWLRDKINNILNRKK